MATAETTVAAPKKSVMRSGAAQKLLAFGALIIIFAFFAIASPVFFTWENIKGIFLATAVNGILALGVTFVIITAGIDLSVGTVMTLSAVMTGVFITFWGLPVPVGILAGLATGTFAGLVNGLFIAHAHPALHRHSGHDDDRAVFRSSFPASSPSTSTTRPVSG
ncbi:MAG: hypothetical protein R2854_19860 [Caldilineaceae bacterium]